MDFGKSSVFGSPVKAGNTPTNGRASTSKAGSVSSTSTPSGLPRAPKRARNDMGPPPLPPPVTSNEEEEVDQLVDDDADDNEFSEEESDGDPNEFKIRNPLDPPDMVMRTIEELHQKLHNEEIDTDPPYQRGIVWDKKKKVALIDSIFRNYHIPPLVFAVKADGTLVCVDGKQRLNSIQEFIDTDIYHEDSATKKKWYYTLPAGRKKATPKMGELPEWAKKQFNQKMLVCYEFRNIPESVERDIFKRVQMGSPLTTAENQKAIQSPWTDLVSRLTAMYVDADDGFLKYISWQTSRNRGFQTIGFLIMVIYEFPRFIAPTANKLTAFLSQQDGPTPDFKRHIQTYMGTFLNLVSASPFNEPFRNPKWPKVAPVEFIYIGALIAHLRTVELGMLSKEVRQLREHIRSKFPDIRMNDRVSKALHEHILKLSPWGGSGSSPTTGTPKKTHASSSTASKKKRRADEMEEDEREYRPSLTSRLKK